MASINGTGGAETLTGSAGDDTLLGLGGDDTLSGNGGRDVLDGGAGFDTATVPDHRYGVRESIGGRMAAAGGRAEVLSAPGAGTRVRLEWPYGR